MLTAPLTSTLASIWTNNLTGTLFLSKSTQPENTTSASTTKKNHDHSVYDYVRVNKRPRCFTRLRDRLDEAEVCVPLNVLLKMGVMTMLQHAYHAVNVLLKIRCGYIKSCNKQKQITGCFTIINCTCDRHDDRSCSMHWISNCSTEKL